MSNSSDPRDGSSGQSGMWSVASGTRSQCVILPSMLLCDFGNLEREVNRLEAAGTAALHLDVMDGHFVPNMTYGLTLVRTFRHLTDLPLDVHLMIEQPERWVEEFRDAGADSMTVHLEATADPAGVLRQIRRLGASAGLAINPPTGLDRAKPLLDLCDLVLVMSVMPGFGGQEFDESALDKLEALAGIRERAFRLQIDGGINEHTIGQAAEAGAEALVVGSAIFRHTDYAAQLRRLQMLADEACSGSTRERCISE